jgi:hypothetical protein
MPPPSEKSYLTGRYGKDFADGSGTSVVKVGSISSIKFLEARSMMLDSDIVRQCVDLKHGWELSFICWSSCVESMKTNPDSLP